MYTILENARIVVDLLKKHKIRYIVISPGGSNIPVIQAVQQEIFLNVIRLWMSEVLCILLLDYI